jgi:Xaa-Pro aminopeptidase
VNKSAERLVLLRAALRQNSIDAYVIPSSDPHLGETIPDHCRIIEWLTGFTGSSATVVITDSFAGLWTDSRYFIQAGIQLAGTGFSLIKPETFKSNDYSDFLEETIKPEGVAGLDGRIFPISQFRKLKNKLEPHKIKINTSCDFISDIWTGRPAMPDSPAFDHPVEFCGKGRAKKIAEVREHMKNRNIAYHLLTSLDDIMWLLNIRGSDVKYSPLLTSFALVSIEQILLFVNAEKIPLKLAAEFDNLGVVILPYEETAGIISAIKGKGSILINPEKISVALFNSISKELNIIEDISIPSILKAVKNKVEIESISKVMIKDGVALARFFFWFENRSADLHLTEVSIADKILELRSRQENFLGPSFATIAAFNEHAALPHYDPQSGSDSEIIENGVLLVDSGGQYMDGTTDITRTIPVGIPSAGQKRDFTLVLKGHINVALAKFPAGTRGYQLDMMARKFLWDSGLNYGHGTGHGVGFCLNVHEGPQSVSPSNNNTAIERGMLISNEPALYREGEYGIRIENLILCYEDEETEFGQFLKFDTISLCYIDKSLIDKSLLDQKEIIWLNSYHKEVYEKLSPFLSVEERNWLKEKTDPLE